MNRGLVILFSVILLLALAGYILRSRTPGLSAFFITLSVLLAALFLGSILKLIPTF